MKGEYMNQVLTTLFGLFGGLSIFIFGMNSMSEALQKAAGERMKKILGILTVNPVMGALAGALVTAILQSSSATTVMVIGFVSAGLMGLPQAISVIFGANIGTTMTAQLIAFDISSYIFPIIFIGFLVNFVSKKDQVKNIGMVIFSFGLLFEGIEIMSSVMKPLAQSPVFTDLMGKVAHIPVLGVLLGLCMTLVVQSSSATIAVLQGFASQAGADGIHSVIGLAGAIPILLGDNIGTTITALLASIGQSRDAKRTAIAHSTFNITGSLVFLFLIRPFAAFIQFVSPKGPELQVISRQIANAHTTFNVVCTLIWLPLLPFMVKFVKSVIPDKKEEQVKGPLFLDPRVIAQPSASMLLVKEELERCVKMTGGIFALISKELGLGAPSTGRKDKEAAEDDRQFDAAIMDIKGLTKSIIDYISGMFASGSLSREQAEEASGLLSVANSLDRIADRCLDAVNGLRGARASGSSFSGSALSELDNCIGAAKSIYSKAVGLLYSGSLEDASAIAKAKNKMRKSVKQFNKAHLKRVEEGKCSEAMTTVYSQILYNLDRIGDNCVSICEEAMDDSILLADLLPRQEQQA